MSRDERARVGHTWTVTLVGVDAYLVDVEARTTTGLGGLEVVGWQG